MKYYLVGFSGSGKSTYGKVLAEKMGLGFVDLDNMVVQKSGKSITQIFEKDGEEAFRKLEYQALLETEKMENVVIATGGGTSVFNNSMEWMNANGITIYLKLFEGDLKSYLIDDLEERPLLKDLDEPELERYIYENLRERAYFYHQSKIIINPMQIDENELSGVLISG